jgi:hypothetical protein
MPAGVVPGHRRRREGRVGERADGDDDQIGIVRLGVEDLRAAVGAEVEDVLLAVLLVRDPRVVGEPAGHPHLVRLETRLHAKGAPGAALAREAVADRDGERLARDLEAELAAVAGGFSHGHIVNASRSA